MSVIHASAMGADADGFSSDWATKSFLD